MIEATLDMLKARRDERVAAAGVLAALFADDLPECVRRLGAVRDSARELARVTPRGDRGKRDIYRRVAAWADDMLAPVEQLTRECAAPAPSSKTGEDRT